MEISEEILRQESKLRQLTIEKEPSISELEARRHLGGLVQRHYMMQASRLFVEKLFSPPSRRPFSPYEATDCAIHLNAYYLNLRGVLDNLAWMLQYEWKILPGVTERSGARQSCYLFAPKFLDGLRIQSPRIAAFLSRRLNWAKELAELRDPAAHRMPIYVGRSVLVSDEQVKTYRAAMAQISSSDPECGGKPYNEILREADNEGSVLPVMFLSCVGNKMEAREIFPQILRDHIRYISLARTILREL